ncbi:peptide deformylase [Brevibacterium pityocampae]|uniref:Peptide deformylase n=2 Tax=Brevibacteriaceae TaxID=85019 RepID=A0ABP8JUE9_9MICO
MLFAHTPANGFSCWNPVLPQRPHGYHDVSFNDSREDIIPNRHRVRAPGPTSGNAGSIRLLGMTIHPIVVYGEPVLHRRAEPVAEFDSALHTLIDDMFETLAASKGVGLAAPQIGVGQQIFVYDADDEVAEVRRRGVFVNPVLVASKIEDVRPDPDTESEGCLSVPGLDFPIKRAHRVTVSGKDADGQPISLTVEGWFARIMQHEFDHLQGTLYVDKLDKRWSKKWKRAQEECGYDEPGISWMPGTDPDPFGH